MIPSFPNVISKIINLLIDALAQPFAIHADVLQNRIFAAHFNFVPLPPPAFILPSNAAGPVAGAPQLPAGGQGAGAANAGQLGVTNNPGVAPQPHNVPVARVAGPGGQNV